MHEARDQRATATGIAIVSQPTPEEAAVNDARRIRGAHSSGKWLLTDSAAFLRNVRHLRQTHTLVTRTEATDKDFNNVLNWPDDGWGVWHPRVGVGHDCSVEWDQTEWKILTKGVLVLTKIRITTSGGFLLEPCALTWAVLVNRFNGAEVEVGAAHLDLSNTPRRREANLESCHTLRAHLHHEQERHPDRHFLYSVDGNRDQRQAKYRRYFDRELMAGTRLRSGWSTPLPRQGTHGRAVLDMSVTDLHGETRLLPDDASSDHRPIEGVWLLPDQKEI
jgi:endonuclease/exonuclease/phosphatase family metal-dependent hydrolase